MSADRDDWPAVTATAVVVSVPVAGSDVMLTAASVLGDGVSLGSLKPKSEP